VKCEESAKDMKSKGLVFT